MLEWQADGNENSLNTVIYIGMYRSSNLSEVSSSRHYMDFKEDMSGLSGDTTNLTSFSSMPLLCKCHRISVLIFNITLHCMYNFFSKMFLYSEQWRSLNYGSLFAFQIIQNKRIIVTLYLKLILFNLWCYITFYIISWFFPWCYISQCDPIFIWNHGTWVGKVGSPS